jgi:hypothetical protein
VEQGRDLAIFKGAKAVYFIPFYVLLAAISGFCRCCKINGLMTCLSKNTFLEWCASILRIQLWRQRLTIFLLHTLPRPPVGQEWK